MISDENIIKMSDQLGQTITNTKEMADIIQQLIKRIEKLEYAATNHNHTEKN